MFDHLSSGLRITSPKDDAAGLAIGKSLQADSRVYGQGIRNINDGISLLNTAEGALQQLSSIATRQSELAEQAANGVYSPAQRLALHKEANALVAEHNRILRSTQYSGMSIIDGVGDWLTVQGGFGSNESTMMSLSQQLGVAAGDGTFTLSTFGAGSTIQGFSAGDLNGDGHTDIAVGVIGGNAINIMINDGSGAFVNSGSVTAANIIANTLLGDIDGDGKQDLVVTYGLGGMISVFRGNGDGTFLARRDYSDGGAFVGNPQMRDINSDGYLDMVYLGTAGSNVNVMLGNQDSSFRAAQTSAIGSLMSNLILNDFNSDGLLDAVSTTSGGETRIMFGTANGSFGSSTIISTSGFSRLVTADLNSDGFADIAATDGSANTSVFFGNGDGSFRARVSYTIGGTVTGSALGIVDQNGDGYLDLLAVDGSSANAYVLLNNGNGTFSLGVSSSTGATLFGSGLPLIGDFNGDGIPDFVGAGGGGGSILRLIVGDADSNGRRNGYQYELDLLTMPGAREALTRTATIRSRISRELGTVGALQSRLSTVVSNLQIRREGYNTASSQILDVDVASEAARMASIKIWQQSAAAVLAQANQQPGLALKLLGTESSGK